MRTYPDPNPKTGSISLFEIDNFLLSKKTVAHILNSIEGVQNVRIIPPFGIFEWDTGLRLRFRYAERECMVVEPFGDNSRFWIGP